MWVTFVVEKWHFKNHVGKFCRENCNPFAYEELKEFNTVVCEQRFKWIGKFKGISQMNMNAPVFNFFILLLCWLDHEQYNSPYKTTVTSSRGAPRSDG